MKKFLSDTHRFNNKYIFEKSIMLPRDSIIQERLETQGYNFLNDLIKKTAEICWTKLCKGKGFLTLGNECEESRVNGTDNLPFNLRLFNRP